MPNRQHLDRETWRWTESVGPEDVKPDHIKLVYRVDLPSCSAIACRRNCRGNPNCLVNLGEKEWLNEISDDHWHEIDDPEEEKRQKNDLVGLKNLGATCYVNTFLQVWFHNQKFREALYQWRPLDKPWGTEGTAGGNTDWSFITDDELQPTSICGHLQLLFALLQFSKRRYIDPSNFINSLGLDAALQQDAQEFSKLFISLLESTLNEQYNDMVKTIIEQQFCGQYSYVTKCSYCANISERPSRFYELDLNIKGHKQLEDCLREFLQEEKLEGANQYLCERCNSKRNASRHIKLQSLPPVLNIQLLRFVFDRQSGTKKKLNNFLQFPEELDMSAHLAKPENEVIYDLKAVLIHRGPTAYSGHYIAHIRSHGDGGAWFKFNDEEIEKMEGRNLKLGSEDEISAGQKVGRRPKVPKGCHTSKNAYMLVYTRRLTQPQTNGAEVPEPSSTSLPPYLQELIQRDNLRFDDWLNEMTMMRNKSVDSGRAMQHEIQSIYKKLPPNLDGRFDWISTEWLKKWLHEESNSAKLKPIDNSSFQCKHKNLDPDQVKNCKRISSQAADLLFAKYDGGPRLDQSSMCQACVKQRCRVLRLQAQLTVDHKFVSDNTKLKCPSDGGYWVGKVSLRQWKRMVLDKEESESDETKDEEDTDTEPTQNGQSSNKDEQNSSQMDQSMEEDEEEDEEPLIFNEDLLCQHRNLSTDVSKRRLVSCPVWDVLRKYFPESSEFKADCEPCLQCQMADAEDAEQAQRKCQLATDQKKSLSQLFHGRNRPSWKKGESIEVYAVPHAFIEAWRDFLRHPLRANLPTHITNGALLCPHFGLLFEPGNISLVDDAPCIALVWPSEWEILKANFKVDYPIRIWKVIAEGPGSCFLTEPEVCQECSQQKLIAEQQAKYQYSGVKLYIRKIAADFSDSPKSALGIPMDSSTGGTSDQENKDPDFHQTNDGKRQKLENGAANSINSRRSTRHRRVRGEKEVIVSSTNTLKELKIKVMHAFSVAPFDQTLLLRGKPLVNNEASLGQLGITPECLITLIVDSPVCDDPLAMDEIVRASSVPEAGFKGTGLLSS